MSRAIIIAIGLLSGCSSDKAITVRNSAPAASITDPIDGMTYQAGDLITFKGIVNDAQTRHDELVVTWDTDKDGLLTDEALADSDGATQFSVADLTPGETHAVTLRVVDEGGKSGSDTVVITIEETPEVIQDEPTVTILAPHPSGSDSPWEEGVPFQFEAQIEDIQDDPGLIMVFVSLVNDDGDIVEDLCSTLPSVPIEDSSIGYAICEASLVPGNHIILFSAEDTEGFVGTAQAALNVISGDRVDNDNDGYTEDEGDCDDTDEDVHPGAFELVNGIDDDCNDLIDDGTTAYDDDGDGYAEDAGDCVDSDPEIYPYAPEICDGIDNDCNGTIDGPDVIDGTTYYRDLDGDGFGDWSSSEVSCDPISGYTTDATDCNDTESVAHPGAPEVCDGIDNDCDAFIDEEGADGCTTWYEDVDDDGYGSTVSVCACAATGDFTSSLSSDCYDSNPSVNPTHTSYHTSNRGDGSYDYNCNDAEEKQWSDVSTTCGFFEDFGCSASDGWSGGSPPSCGSTSTWRTDCHYEWDWFGSGCYWSTESSRTQACR
jgi:hypothetical protein